jgi:hypothetical protein
MSVASYANSISINHMIAKKMGFAPNLKKMDVTQNLVEDA